MKEIWKSIPGYEGFYEASDLGNIKSLERKYRRPGNRIIRERILKPNATKKGYYRVELYLLGRKKFSVHRLVMLAFKGESNLQVDHINGIRDDNRLINLEYVTNRENICRGLLCDRKNSKSSELRGVSLVKNRFKAQVSFNCKKHHLGSFIKEEDAAKAYQDFVMTHA